jgi:hypothetical protein
VSPPGASEDVLEAQALFQGGAGLMSLPWGKPIVVGLAAYLLPNSKKLSSAKSKLYSTSKFSHSRELSGTSGGQQELIERSLLPARSWELYMFCEKTCQWNHLQPRHVKDARCMHPRCCVTPENYSVESWMAMENHRWQVDCLKCMLHSVFREGDERWTPERRRDSWGETINN